MLIPQTFPNRIKLQSPTVVTDLITHPTLTTFYGVFSSSSPGVYFPSPSNYFAIIFLSEWQLLGNPNQNNLLSIALGTS